VSRPFDPEESAETSGLALASVFAGILWFFGLGSLAAIGFGFAALRQIRESRGRTGGRLIAIAGIVIGLVGLASAGVLIAFLVSSAHHETQLPSPGA